MCRVRPLGRSSQAGGSDLWCWTKSSCDRRDSDVVLPALRRVLLHGSDDARARTHQSSQKVGCRTKARIRCRVSSSGCITARSTATPLPRARPSFARARESNQRKRRPGEPHPDGRVPAFLGKPGGCGTRARQKERARALRQSSPTAPGSPAILGGSQGRERHTVLKGSGVAYPCAQYPNPATPPVRAPPCSTPRNADASGDLAEHLFEAASCLHMTRPSCAGARCVEYRRVTIARWRRTGAAFSWLLLLAAQEK